jgi:GT2 family glycosyltransferase
LSQDPPQADRSREGQEGIDRLRAEKLLEERARLRRERDFAGADRLRDRLHAGGWDVVDRAEGSVLEAVELPPPPRRLTCMTVVHGWTDDAQRWLDSILRHDLAVDREALLVDNSGSPDVARWADASRREGVRILHLEPPRGFGAAVNAGIDAAAGEVIVLFDPGTEATGDVGSALIEALKQPQVVLAGAFGVRGHGTLKHFHEHAGPEVEAVEGYCLAFHRAQAIDAGGFDEKFNFYRMADIEFSFRLRDRTGGSAVVVGGLPLQKHAHRLWETADPAERERLSKKNFYRFLDRFGKREDLLLG